VRTHLHELVEIGLGLEAEANAALGGIGGEVEGLRIPVLDLARRVGADYDVVDRVVLRKGGRGEP